MGLALETQRPLRLPDFARSFVGRAANILGARQAALVVKQESGMETWSYTAAEGREIQERYCCADSATPLKKPWLAMRARLSSSTTTELFGRAGLRTGERPRNPGAAAGGVGRIGWRALPGRPRQRPADEDNQVLHAIAGHAAVALRMPSVYPHDQANRTGSEIFDAISDFIVAHDEAGKRFLRVNRSTG